MSDEPIDLIQYFHREQNAEGPSRGAFALSGANRERSQFALSLWQTIYLAEGERGAIVWRGIISDDVAYPFLVLVRNPAKLKVGQGEIPLPDDGEPPALHGFISQGVTIFLGSRGDRNWHLVVDGGEKRLAGLSAKKREDILFLAAECAGLLFSRDFADKVL